MSDELLKLQAAYWTKRLDHTLTHTQTASRLIYALDGAVLAFVYFFLRLTDMSRGGVAIASFPVLVLAVLNLFHALLIGTQREWYASIDKELQALLIPDDANPPIRPRRTRRTQSRRARPMHTSTHGLYQLMHLTLAVSVFVIGLAMFMYGVLGIFPDLKSSIEPSYL